MADKLIRNHQEKRIFFERWLSFAAEVFLGLYLVLLISLYPESSIYCNNLATLALVCGIILLILRPPGDKPIWPYWTFIGGIAGFYLVNLLAVGLAEKIPGIGHTSSAWEHLPGLLLALTTAVSVRNRRSAGRVLAVLLIVAGLWYLGEVISLPWRYPYFQGRFVGHRGHHTQLSKELLLLFSLYLGYAALLSNRRLAAAALFGAVLMGVLLFMTKTRFALLAMMFVTIPSVFVIQNRFGAYRRRLICALAWILIIAPAMSLIWYKTASPERKSLAHAETRIAAWKIIIQIAEKESWFRKLVGHGRFSDTFSALVGRYNIDESGLQGEKLAHAHNTILQTFLETGLLGVAILILIWASAFYRALSAWLRRREADAVIPGVMVVALISIAVMAQMDYILWKLPELLSFFLLGLAAASGANDE